jgi:hypothetical protein
MNLREASVRSKQVIWLAVFVAAALTFSGQAKAGPCNIFGFGTPTCFVGNDVVYLYYGTLTLLAPDGSLLSTTDLETAETGLGGFSNEDGQSTPTPAAFVSLFPSLVGQMQSDPQVQLSTIPSWAISNIANLGDSNGLGFVQDPTAPLNSPSDPAVASFENQLANVGGPYTTLSDTGFLLPPTTAAYCDYFNTVLSPVLLGETCTPQTVPSPTTSFYEFTYQLGPDTIGSDTYTSDVNFQIYYRDVTEELVATPEPAMLAPLLAGLIAVGFLRRRNSNRLRQRSTIG